MTAFFRKSKDYYVLLNFENDKQEHYTTNKIQYYGF